MSNIILILKTSSDKVEDFESDIIETIYIFVDNIDE